MDHNIQQVQETPFKIGSAMKSMVGFVLLIIGVSLGLYVVTIGLGLISAEDPPAITTKLTEPCLDQAQNVVKDVVGAVNANDGAHGEGEANEEGEANAKEGLLRVELSSDVKQVSSYVIVFLLLAIAISFAATLIQGGVKLLQRDANDAIKEIAARLK